MAVNRSVLLAVALIVGAASSPSAQSTEDNNLDDGVVIGIEQSATVGIEPVPAEEYKGRDKVIRALFKRTERIEEAILVLQDKINDVNALAVRSDQVIRRGQEPLVSLELDQLSKQVAILEDENVALREALTAAGIIAPIGGVIRGDGGSNTSGSDG